MGHCKCSPECNESIDKLYNLLRMDKKNIGMNLGIKRI